MQVPLMVIGLSRSTQTISITNAQNVETPSNLVLIEQMRSASEEPHYEISEEIASEVIQECFNAAFMNRRWAVIPRPSEALPVSSVHRQLQW